MGVPGINSSNWAAPPLRRRVLARIASALPLLLWVASLTFVPASVAEAAKVASPSAERAPKSEGAGHSDAKSHGSAASHNAAAEHGEHHPTLRGEPVSSENLLDFSNWLFAWTLILFLLFCYVMSRLVWNPIVHALEVREQKISDSLAEAQRVRDEAKVLLEQHDEVIGRAHEEAKQILETARAESAKESEVILNQARDDAAQAELQARTDIAAASRDALEQLEKGALALAAQFAGRIADRPFQPEDARPYLPEDRR